MKSQRVLFGPQLMWWFSIISIAAIGCTTTVSATPTSDTQMATRIATPLDASTSVATSTPQSPKQTTTPVAIATPRFLTLSSHWYATLSNQGNLLESTSTLRVFSGATDAAVYEDSDPSFVPLEWSRDGENLLLNKSGGDLGVRLAIWNRSTSLITSLDIPLSGGANQLDGTWDPSGKQIAFVQSGDMDRHLIYVLEVGTLATHFVAEGVTPAWSPDGAKIAFVSPEQGIEPSGKLFLFDVASETVSAVDLPFFVDHPRWSRDGSMLLLATVDTSRSKFGTAIYQASTGGITNVETGGSQMTPVWGLDDESILLIQSGKLVSLTIATGESEVVRMPSALTDETIASIILAP